MEIINGRYKILKQIVKDRFTTSFVVLDMFKNNKKVLLVLLESNESYSQLIEYYKNEYIYLKSIQHDFILKNESFDSIYTIDNKESKGIQYFYTREHDEKDHIHYMRINNEKTIDLFYKICIAIRYLHFRGIRYLYLNLDNILFTENKYITALKLMDMAYIKQMDYERGKIANYNHQFFSPEFQIGIDSENFSDIYSLGVVLFYLFYKKDYKTSYFREEFEIIKKERNDMVINIINKMTANETTERYKSIKEIIEELEKLFPLAIEKNSDSHLRQYETLNFNTKLVNREREMSHISQLIDLIQKPNSHSMCLMIEGEEGIGKSRLVKEIMYKLRIDKINNYFSTYEYETEISYASLRTIIKQMLKNTNYDLIHKYGSELVKIIPEIRKIWDVMPSTVLFEEKEKLRLHDRIFNFISEYIGNSPTVIIVENMHYSDINTIELVDYFFRNEKKVPILFIITYKANENSLLNSYIKKWVGLEYSDLLHLTKFNLQETATHIQNILGMAWKPLPLATRVIKVTEGNPRYIEEVIKNLFTQKLIAVNEDLLWVAKDVDDIEKLKLPSILDETVVRQLRLFKKTDLEVLNVISTFDSSVSLEVISDILNIDQVKLKDIINEFVSAKIINEKLEDWGYTYDFYKIQIKAYVYNSMEINKRSSYHNVASDVLEEYYKKEDRDNKDEIIHHLRKCGKLSRAIDYCLEAANKMLDLNIYAQALEFYDVAVQLLDQHKDIKRNNDILLTMGKIYAQIGQNDKAVETYQQIIRSGSEKGYYKSVIDSKNKLADIYILKNMLPESLNEIRTAKSLALENCYEEGFLEAELIFSNLILIRNEIDHYEEIVKSNLTRSLAIKNNNYVGQFLNQRGKFYLLKGDYDSALMDFIGSINYFEKASNILDSIKPVNNIGVVMIEGLQDSSLARKYYLKALGIAEKQNLVSGTNLFYLNIGETYLIEDQYDLAIKYFNKSIQLSDETKDRSVLLLVYTYMSRVFLQMGEYQKAHNYIKKAEIEKKSRLYNKYDSLEFSLLVIEFYKEIGLKEQAILELGKIEKPFVEFDDYHNFMHAIYKLFILSESVDEKTLQSTMEFLFTVEKKAFIKQKRLFVLEMAYLFINNELFNQAKQIIEYDDLLATQFSTQAIELKKKILLGYLDNNKIAYYTRLLEKESSNLALEWEWRINLILGDEYCIQRELYKAINCYMDSLDTIKRLVLKVPVDLQLSYMNSDQAKLEIKSKITRLKSIILEETLLDSEYHSPDMLSNKNLENYFDTNEFQLLFQNERFFHRAIQEYEGFFSRRVTSIRELMQEFSSNDILNIQSVLKYCIMISLSTKGFVVITDSNYNSEEVIKIDEKHELRDVDNILDKIIQKKEGVLIKNRYDMKMSSTFDALPGKSQAVICIPIIQFIREEKANTEQRKNWRKENKRLLGYLYLETDKVFNNFDWNTYKNCEALANLLSVLIDNYKIKVASSVDKLTNVLVRKYIEKELKNEIYRADLSKTVFSIIMGDIDKFKQVNDSFGHQTGDFVLRQVGKIMKDNIRSSDKVGRYGGEEFIFVLPDTDTVEAHKVSEKIRCAIQTSNLLGNAYPVTMSFGISTFTEHGMKDDELIEKADQALYYAKETGRNKSVIWNKNIGLNKNRVDKLAGVISGNVAQDHRIVQAIIEIIALAKNDEDRKIKIHEMLGRLIETTEAKNGTYIDMTDNQGYKTYSRERFKEEWIEGVSIDWKTVDRVKSINKGEFYIDWEDVSSVNTVSGTPDWQSRIVLPIIYFGKTKGVLQLSVPIKEKEFDFKSFNLINSLTGIIGSLV